MIRPRRSAQMIPGRTKKTSGRFPETGRFIDIGISACVKNITRSFESARRDSPAFGDFASLCPKAGGLFFLHGPLSGSFNAIVFLLLLAGLPSLSFPDDIYHVDPVRGNDRSEGTAENPLKSFDKALNLLAGKGGEIHFAPGTLLRQHLRIIRKSGLPGKPIVIDGHGVVINLGIDLTGGPWTKIDEGFRYGKPVPKHHEIYSASVVFVNGFPLHHYNPNRPSEREWHGGSSRYDDEGRLIIVFPKGLDPTNAVVVLTGTDDQCSGLLVNGSSHVVLKNMIVVFAGNDGFNFHGVGENVRLENVTALFNGDEGISAHETYQVHATDSEVAFSGSRSGGIADVDDSETTYRNIRSHQNRTKGFHLTGKKHRIEHCIGYGNPSGNLPEPNEKTEVVDCTDGGRTLDDETIPFLPKPVENFRRIKPLSAYTGQHIPASGNPIKESDRLGRFLRYRPKASP